MNKKSIFFKDSAFKYLVGGSSLIVVAFFVMIFVMLAVRSYPSMANDPLMIFGSTWDVNSGLYGGIPAILGTLASSAIAVALAVPISLGMSVFFTEYAPRRVRAALSIVIDMLATIPSVIFGIWGLWIVAPLVKTYVQDPIVGSIGFIPLFSGPAYGLSLFLASLVLTFMIVPIISSLTISLLSTTPVELREAMISLGATRWEVVRHVALPFSKLGIFASIILALGRALGETMAVTMVIGNSFIWPFSSISLFSPASTITSKIASELYEAVDVLHVSSLVELGLILLVITLLVNSSARLVITRISRRNASG
ncbi:MAG: phosphate ABC transporter permease subunit PstC [Candidatus Methanosuratincola petrocarbonis]|uniref:Phosphate transport system permease protein n=2 Tax=Candidatus Methanosuratincola (ex Vanwonterghem et al. 2016) TaxID=1915412 RepID=A0A7J3UZT0_9CREN|nr:MAG: Phosphate transport system permease protein PstC [Candidatus Methanosuratincola subterraneus]